MREKLYIVKKYVKARNAAEAVRREKKLPVDDVFVDDEWRTENRDRLAETMGFPKEVSTGFKDKK